MSAARPRRRGRASGLPPSDDDWTVGDGDEPTLTRVEGPTALSGELARLTRRPGWGERLGAARVWAAWDDMAGAELAAHCEPVRLAGRVLVVRADSPAWATQLRYLSEQLIERACAELGPGSVREVRVTVGRLEGRDGVSAPGDGGTDGGHGGAEPLPLGHPVDVDAPHAPTRAPLDPEVPR